ncbi:MAG: hypothetical protein DI547_00930 [Sphingobium sp.]|nr:MAG: hypothetical protein DI547_00930 [Sphingobium sp.]
MLIRSLSFFAALLLSLAGIAPAAQARGIVLEGNYVHAQGDWGTELGGGLETGSGGFAVRPIVGAFLHDGDTSFYAKGEVTYTIPAFAEVGGGVRLSGDKARLYGTASVPLAPFLRLKGNVGDHYYGVGLRVGF